MAIGGSDIIRHFREIVKRAGNDIDSSAHRENCKMSASHCQELLRTLWQPILAKKNISESELREQIERLRSKAMEESRGPREVVTKCISDFLEMKVEGFIAKVRVRDYGMSGIEQVEEIQVRTRKRGFICCFC